MHLDEKFNGFKFYINLIIINFLKFIIKFVLSENHLLFSFFQIKRKIVLTKNNKYRIKY